MEKLSEMMGQVPTPEPCVEKSDGDYLDEKGILICGKCGMPKQKKYPRPDIAGGGFGLASVPASA